MTDAEALDWLDRLLSADEAARRSSLDALANSNPALHARLERMLAGALAPDVSHVFAGPVLDGIARIADSTRALTCGDVFAGYRLIREIGRGGMSVVWLAERADGVVKRQVALKMPMFVLLSAVDAERFTRERDALAALAHPNVARLYDAGVTGSGQSFIVLEYVAGATLTRFCDERRLDLRARVRLFLQVLAAVDHAHRHLVVHRDLKPSNILVDGDGQVRLLDFGIAKLLGDADAPALTQQAGGALTPSYAAPEQIRGEAVSTLTDVFSLGIVLHELLSGALPYDAHDGRTHVVAIHEQLSRGELPRASKANIDDVAARDRGLATATRLRAQLTGDLDTIIGKALRIAPEDRYASVAHLADDLKRWLDHQPVAARRPNLWYVTRLALRRHRLAAAVAGVGLALVAATGVMAFAQFRDSRAHAARTAAVRDFMFDLVNDAEASEGQQGDVTGRQMLDGAVRRARRDFGAQPQLQGELLSELGRMYIRLESADAAVPVLEESIRVLEAQVHPGDPALNKSRVFLAGALLQTSDDLTRIEQLAHSARDACASDQVDCRKARAYANGILSQIASFAGDDAAALTAMRASARDMELGFGAAHEETALSFMSLAITARNAGELNEAGAAMQRALAASRSLRMREADRVALERTMAVIDLDLGHYAAARDRLVQLVDRTKNSAERARQLRILANVHAELGNGPEALRTADLAIGTLPADASADELPYARQARARGLALMGRPVLALAEIDAVLRAFLEGGRSPDAFEVLRARRYRAEFLLLAGRDAEALQLLRDLRARQASRPASAVEAGLTLDLLGAAEARVGEIASARAAHAAARTALLRQLPPGHPYLSRNSALQDGVGP